VAPIFKSGDKNNPFNHRTIMINPLLAKLYGIIWEKRLAYDQKDMEKELKAKPYLEAIIQLWTIFLRLGSLWRSVAIIKPIFCVVSLTLENILTRCPRLIFGIG
jgi:hypothetical protein